MKLLESLKQILREQVQGCRQLLELLQREKVCLLDLHLDGLETITKEKDVLVLKLRLLEEERTRLLDCLQTENPQGSLNPEMFPETLTLQRLAEITGESDFMDLRSKLISLSQSIKELNGSNKIMIDRTLAFLKKSTAFLGVFLPGSSPMMQKGGRLSREM